MVSRQRTRATLRLWHLLGAASRGAVGGQFVAACGENLGDQEAMLERVDDESVIGNRCSVCQAIALSP
jgi:hypothetical protein